MMMPADPTANLVVGQSRLALAALEAFFNPMLCLGHTRELRQRHRAVGARRQQEVLPVGGGQEFRQADALVLQIVAPLKVHALAVEVEKASVDWIVHAGEKGCLI